MGVFCKVRFSKQTQMHHNIPHENFSLCLLVSCVWGESNKVNTGRRDGFDLSSSSGWLLCMRVRLYMQNTNGYRSSTTLTCRTHLAAELVQGQIKFPPQTNHQGYLFLRFKDCCCCVSVHTSVRLLLTPAQTLKCAGVKHSHFNCDPDS